MIAVELYRPDELSLYSSNDREEKGVFSHGRMSEEGAYDSAFSNESADPYRMLETHNHQDEDNNSYLKKFNHTPNNYDDENPYLKDAQRDVSKSSMKKQRK
jgi:hypothetical protein